MTPLSHRLLLHETKSTTYDFVMTALHASGASGTGREDAGARLSV